MQYDDIISHLGGIKSAITPLLAFLTPLLVMYFLVKLSEIIREAYVKEYIKELENTIALFTGMLPSD